MLPRAPPPVPGFSSPYSSARLSVWQRSLGLMSWRWRWSPGGLLCLPSACDAHPFDAVSLDLPSDVARGLLVGRPQTLFICSADRTHRPSEGYCALSEASWVLSARYRPRPLISRGWWPVGPVRRLRELSHCKATRVLLARASNHAAPPSAGRAHLSQCGEPFAGPRLSPPRPGRPQNHEVHSGGRWGPLMHAKPLPQST